MSHHGREYEQEVCGSSCALTAQRLMSAVQLISDLSRGQSVEKGPSLCDAWLESHGYACAATRKAERDRRAAELDAEIARLCKERELL